MKLVSADWLLPMDQPEPIANGALAIDGEKIVAVGTADNLQKEFPNAEIEKLENTVLMPGLVNAHCHLDRTGFFERFPYETDRKLDPITWLLESLHYLSQTSSTAVGKLMKGALQHQLELGVTCLGAMTHYEGAYPVVAASPLRGVLYQEILSAPDKRAQQRFEVALALIDKYKDAQPDRLRVGFGPYAAYALSKNLLNIIALHAKDGNLPLQIHAAEHFAEMEFFFESKGTIATKYFPTIGWEELPPCHRKTPIEFLEGIGFFATPLSIVGGYQMRETDFAKLARGLAKVIYCPSSNRRFGLGTFPLQQLRKQGIPIGLGTELQSGEEGLNLWSEMKLALQEGSRPLPTPFEILQMATQGGAYALGFEGTIGTLQAGKTADYLAIIKPDHLLDRLDETPESLYRELIQQTTPSSIRQIVISGKTVKKS